MIVKTEGLPGGSERPAIHLAGVHKAYQRGSVSTAVLAGVDLIVNRGECVFLAGPSGSGKTTLLSIVGCILSVDKGRVRILDQDIQVLNSRQRAALRLQRIGFVFQRFHLIRGLTALDNVCVPLTLAGVAPQAARRRAVTLLESVGLADELNKLHKNLSTGQCQRVALARALAGDPDLILADEPTASLDAKNGRDVMELLRRLTTDEGKTAVVVTHDHRIFRYADQVHYLENGQIVETEEPVAVSS